MRRTSAARYFLRILHRWRPPVLRLLAAVLRRLYLRSRRLRLLGLIVPLRYRVMRVVPVILALQHLLLLDPRVAIP